MAKTQDLLKSGRLHRWLTITLQLMLLIGASLALVQGRWLTAVTTVAIVLVTLLPVAIGKRFGVTIPPEFEMLAVAFVYASLFLGEVRDYYVRFWWWDVVLHIGSGLILGILGFLLVYVLNEKDSIALDMKPSFVALFAFMFAITLGALWEIFEFGVDQLFGLNMQKSGLTDTMWDLIVDTLGAGLISILGYKYLTAAGSESFLERWLANFIAANPRLFGTSAAPD
jgi:hypothetical protein